MKTLIQFFSLLLLVSGMSSCETGPTDLDKDYRKTVNRHDSLVQVGENMQDSLDTYRAEHQMLMQRLQTADTLDTAHLETMARHKVMLKEVEAMIAKHRELHQAHQEIQQNTDELSRDELRAQIDEMQEHHDMMDNEHQEMRSKFSTIRSDHEDIMQQLRDQDAEDTEERDAGS